MLPTNTRRRSISKPMLTLDRYITRIANRTILAVLAALLSLISLFALFEELEESQVTYGLLQAATYILQTMPRRLDEIMVYGLFLGYLITLGRLAESNELTICRVAGMSPLRLCTALGPSMVLWLILSVVISEYVAPISERSAEANKLHAQYGNDALNKKGGLWVRDGQMFMQVKAIDEKGDILGISQYWLDPNDTLVESVNAERGYYDAAQQSWVLEEVVRTQLDANRATRVHLDQWRWQNSINPELLASQAFLKPNKMSMAALYRQMRFARSQNLGVSEYELAFWTRALKPLTFIGLTLFALAVVMGPLRQVGMGLRLTFGIFAGLGFKYLQDLFAPAAMVFNIPAMLAILIPIAIYWSAAWLLISRNS